LYSSVNNHDTSTSILSIGEMIGIVVVFSFLLYLLFPKQDIEHIIETKGKNTNLSINYLESMLLYYPDNIKLEMILLQNYDYENKRKKAFKLINKVLSQTKDKKILDKLYKTEYRLLKEEYFDTKNKNLLPKIKEKLYNYYKFVGDDRDYVYFFAEATQMNFEKLKYISLKGLMRQKPELINYQLEKEAFFLDQLAAYPEIVVPRVLGYGRQDIFEYTVKTRMPGVAALTASRYLSGQSHRANLCALGSHRRGYGHRPKFHRAP